LAKFEKGLNIMWVLIFNIVLFFVSFVFLVHPAAASRIEVVNENETPIKVKIQAEGNNFEEKITTYAQEIPGEYYFSFWVVASELKGKPYYSIKGYTSAFMPGGKCNHLSVEKNYRVTFLNDALGTTCIAEEIQ
jgi:hypothetical protein